MLQTLQTRFYTDWDFYRRVLAITLPIAIQNVINLGVNMMDIIMLGQLGDTAIAAANLGGQLFIILNVTGFGLASGAAVLIASTGASGTCCASGRSSPSACASPWARRRCSPCWGGCSRCRSCTSSPPTRTSSGRARPIWNGCR